MGVIKVRTSLNNTALANASKEYIAETIFHEIMHGYFDANGTILDEFAQHVEMATAYLNKEVAALQEVFPGLNTHDAQCMVIGGYADIQTNNPALLNQILSQYGLTLNDVASTNNSFKNGSKGTKC